MPLTVLERKAFEELVQNLENFLPYRLKEELADTVRDNAANDLSSRDQRQLVDALYRDIENVFSRVTSLKDKVESLQEHFESK